MAENKLADLSIEFAVSILKATDGTKGHYSLINQLERSATSPLILINSIANCILYKRENLFNKILFSF